jgi:LysM repeat protein
MKPVVWLPSIYTLFLILTGCADNNSTVQSDPNGTGPFDKYGNYREDWVADPSKWTRPGRRQQNTPTDDLPTIAKNEEPPANANPLGPAQPSITQPRVASTPRETVKPTVVTAKPKPKPKVVAKLKTKPKPKSTRYIVKSGDSLSRIASRYGSSVSAIQKANRISGTLIRPGQSLAIPKR